MSAPAASFGVRAILALLGLALLPAIYATGRTLFKSMVLLHDQPRSIETLVGFCIGMASWFLLAKLPGLSARPYVLAHEATHALWAFLHGARVSGMKVGKGSGHVKVSHTNVWIVLAPYFFPFYSVCVLVLAGLLFLCGIQGQALWLPPALGFTWAFHVHFTILALGVEQSDIRAYGSIFSLPLILLINLAILLVGVLFLNGISINEDLRMWIESLASTYGAVIHLVTERISHLFSRSGQ